MVLSRNEKRKRKEGDLVDLMEPLSETPKRTKVHAQRKFAQGASTVFNPPYTPVKDKERIKPSIMKELITHKRPNTEDFLTFLCYRGTSILPPGLNFFNVGAKKEKDPKSIRAVTDKNISPSNIVNEIQKGDTNQKILAKVKNIITDTKRVSNEIQKNITKFKTTTSTVQALKKKYQEQRLAKQRIQNKFKSSCVMRTRSCTERNILKAGCTLTSRKFLPRIEAKRHGLRSTAIVHKHKKASPKVKTILPKSKKKVLVKSKSSDMSNSDVTSEDEEIPSEKSVPQLKRPVQKSVQKICTRSKSELRRVTRSHTGKITSKTISRRPTRKTKEAAALYMEILGRKLVSPDLGNDDNASVESFPELPNARKQISPERVVKDKVKQNTIKSIGKSKSNKSDSFRTNTNSKRLDKSKSRKIVFKSKRILRVQRYCEIDSDDESASSMQSNNARPSTRQSVNKLDIPVGRSLRSSSRNIITRLEGQNRLNIKTPPLAQNLKTTKTKFVMKRKRDTSINKTPCQKNNKSKLGTTKTHQNENVESDEETLGMLLDKMKKKKDFLEEVTHASTCTDNVTDIQTNSAEIHNVKEDLSKASDDEGSFRGFTQKAISNVLNSCQTHASVGLFETDETTDKLSICEAKDVSLTAKDVTINEEEKESTPLITETVHKTSTFLQEQDTIVNLRESPESTLKVDKKFTLNESETSSAHIIDMSLSALHVRKERVNMSTEQIEKWLSESSLAKEESKLEMENMSSFRYDVGISQKLKPDASHLSISTKIQHLVRPVNVTVSKLADKTSGKERIGIQNKCNSTVLSHLRVNELKHPHIPSDKTIGIKDIAKERIKSVHDTFSEDNEVGSKVDSNSTDGSVDKKLLEKKSIVQPRKPFLPKVKERKVITPNANAFSPENESSVYAFESDTEIPVGTPFRRKARDSGKPNASIALSETEVIKSELEDAKNTSQMSQCSQNILGSNTIKEKSDAHDKKNMANTSLALNKFELSKNFVNLANVQVLPFDKLTTSWTNVNCSASIAVQVNFDDNTEESEPVKTEDLNKQKSTEISTQTECNNENDDDNDGQLFYIPLQAVTRNGPNLLQGQQLIQGVAVKLGTEGTNGPNQRVLLRAKLVTKPPVSVARCPPVGTVQPTTRTPQNCTTTLTQQSVVSTSTNTTSVAAVTNTEHQSPVLTRNESAVQINVQDNNLSTTTATQSSPEKVIKSPKPSRDCKVHTDSMKNTKRSYTKSKQKLNESSSGVNGSTLPNCKGMNNEARLVEAPTFHPTEKDFQDPLEYIDKIRPVAEKFGICRVVPPPNFKPDCKVSDDMRFTAYNQYVHRMLHRWGPNVKEMMAIKKYLATQSITLTQPPWIGGMEVDLPHLYQTVQSLGGLKEVIEKKKWQKVADGMKIPKSAQDRVTKLDDIYCKYLLPYDTLSQEERAKLFNEVEVEWLKREAKALQRQELLPMENEDDDEDDSSDEIEECIVKGRNMPLDAFYRIARNTQRMWFGENQRSGNEAEGASADEVETAFWRHVAERKRHVCVHAASIDSGGRGFGFSVARYSPFARHPWNLKVFTNNAGSVLRALGPLMGVTVPTLHVGMLFSACCWYRDPHGLPWIEYLHTGGKKIWYGIPNEHNDSFREALSKMVPRYCKNKTIWLPSDTAMVPPELLVSNGVPLCQTVQEPGQFIIVFPKAFTSSICTGYVVSESVYFAQASWLETAEQVFKDIQDSSEPSIFSFERLLFNIINDSRSHIDILKQILPSVIKICEKEIDYRKRLESLGLTDTERIPLPDSGKRRQRRRVKQGDSDYECDTCRANLFVSSVNNGHDDSVYCLSHALQMLTQKRHLSKHCTLMYTYSEEELNELIQKLEDRIEAKSKKSNHIKQSK